VLVGPAKSRVQLLPLFTPMLTPWSKLPVAVKTPSAAVRMSSPGLMKSPACPNMESTFKGTFGSRIVTCDKPSPIGAPIGFLSPTANELLPVGTLLPSTGIVIVCAVVPTGKVTVPCEFR
jgi:hypothetical protein